MAGRRKAQTNRKLPKEHKEDDKPRDEHQRSKRRRTDALAQAAGLAESGEKHLEVREGSANLEKPVDSAAPNHDTKVKDVLKEGPVEDVRDGVETGSDTGVAEDSSVDEVVSPSQRREARNAVVQAELNISRCKNEMHDV